MKKRQLALALIVVLTWLALLPRSALAQCDNAAGAPIACPGEKERKTRSTATPLPTPVPTTGSSNAVLPLLPGAGGQPGETDWPVEELPGPGGPPSRVAPVVQLGVFLGLGFTLAGGYVVVNRARRRRRSVTTTGTAQHELAHNLGLSHHSDSDVISLSMETGPADLNAGGNSGKPGSPGSQGQSGLDAAALHGGDDPWPRRP